MKRFFFPIALTTLLSFLLVQPSKGAPAGNDNLLGPTGEYNGSITTGGSYDPYTGNAKRFVDDLTVTGSVGTYPLKWTRILNTRNPSPWSHSYQWGLWVKPYAPYHYYDPPYEGPGGQVTYPDGRILSFAIATQPYTYDGDIFGAQVQDRLIHKGGGNFDLLMRDGGTVRFEHPAGSTSGGDLIATKIIDPYGLITSLNRDAAGRLSQIVEPGGRYLQINYTNGVMTSIQAFSAPGQLTETVTYGYTNNNLTQVNYDDGTHASYTYGASNNGVPGLLIRTCDDVRYAGPMKKIEYEYMTDSHYELSFGQIKREKNATTHQTVSEVTYPMANHTALTDADFQRTETRGDDATRLFQYSSDGHGELKSYTDFKGKTTRIEYIGLNTTSLYRKSVTDARLNTTSTDLETNADAVMKIIYPPADTGVNPTVEFTYSDSDKPFYMTGRKDENGYWTYYDRDVTNPDPTKRGRLLKIRYPDGSTEEFTYNNFNQVLTHKLLSGGTESFEYDNHAPPAIRGLKTKQTDAMGNATTYQYYSSGPNTDRVWKVTDPRNNTTTFEYNQRGQVTKVTHQDTTYSQSAYNDDGTLAWTADENHPGAATDPNQRTRYTYDEYKRLLTVTNPLGETTTNYYGLDWANPLLHTTNAVKYTLSPMGKSVIYEYDENFRKTYQGVALGTDDAAESRFQYDEVGNLIWARDPRFKVTTFGYDQRNRQTSVTDPLIHTTTTTYDPVGNKKTVTRPGNPPIQFLQYDPMNRLTEKMDERGFHSYLHYDYAGNLTWQQDENGHIYEYGYDALRRKTSMTYPGAGEHESWSYDEVGGVKTHINRAGGVQTYAAPDNRNRPTSFTWSDGTPGQSFEYDAKSRLRRTYNAEADISWTYDDADRKTGETETVYSFGLNRITTVTWGYDHDGNLSRTIYPAGSQFVYQYTQRSQLANVKLDPAIFGATYNTPLAAYTYDGAGNRSQRTLFNGGITQYAVDDANRLTALASYFANNRLGRFDYGYDQLNRRKYEQRDFGVADGFQYDPSDEITDYQRAGTLNGNGTVTSATTGHLVLDGAGNRTQVTGNWAPNSYSVNALNQYTSDAGGAAHYDLKGNLDLYGGWTFTYDAVNRLTALDNSALNQHIVYKYDALNRRIAQRVNGQVTSYVFDNWNLIEEYAGPYSPPPSPTPTATATATATATPRATATATSTATATATSTPRATATATATATARATATATATASATATATPNVTPDPCYPITTPQCGQEMTSSDTLSSGGIRPVLADLRSSATRPTEVNRPRARVWPSLDPASDYMLASYVGPSKRSSGMKGTQPRTMSMATVNTASSATPVAVYLWAGGEIVANVTMGYYYFQDGRGNVTHLTNSSNVLTERYTYDLNGTVSYFDGNVGNGNSLTGSSVSNRFLFAGTILLPEANLYDMRNRMYFPRWGRFLQTDPIGFKGDASNLYRYCSNDPVDRSDPMGTDYQVNHDQNDASHVIIVVPIVWRGGTQVERADFTRGLETRWTSKFRDRSYETRVVNGKKVPEAQRNYITIYKGEGSADTSGRVGHWYTRDTGGWSREAVGGHDGGHLLGHPDRYVRGSGPFPSSVRDKDNNPVPQPGYDKDNIMVNPNGWPSREDFDAIEYGDGRGYTHRGNSPSGDGGKAARTFGPYDSTTQAAGIWEASWGPGGWIGADRLYNR